MVLWWKRNAEAPRVALESRLSAFAVTPGLSGMGSVGTERRKLLVMPEEVLSSSLFELFWLSCLVLQNKTKKIKRNAGRWFYSVLPSPTPACDRAA